MDFLGHHVSAAGVSPIASRVTAINDHPRPTTMKELQGFLSVINFYRRFIPAAAHILKPLTDQLKGGAKAGGQHSVDRSNAGSFCRG